MNRLPLLLAAVALIFPATAAAKDCPTKSVYSAIETTDVGCKQAKRLFKAYFKDGSELFGFNCSSKQYPGGVTFTCKKDARKAVFYSAD